MSTTLPTLKIADVQKAIYTWIKEQLDGVIDAGAIIWRDQSQPLPPRPCVTMKIIDGPRRISFSDSVKYLSGGQFTIGGQRVMTVSIQVFGNTQVHRPMAYQTASDLCGTLPKMTVQDKLRGAGIGLWNLGDVTNLTELEETEFEERAQFDVTLGLAQNVVDDPGIIEHVGVITHTID